MTAPQQPESEPADGSGTPPVPRVLEIARWAWIGTALIEFVRSVWQLADRERLTSEVHRTAPELSQQQLDATVNSGVLFTLLFSLALLVVYVGLSTRMLQGRNWARVVLAVFGGFNVFGTLVTLLALGTIGRGELVRMLGTNIEGSDIGFSVLVMLLNVAALVLVFLPDANRFFRSSRPPSGNRLPGPFGRW